MDRLCASGLAEYLYNTGRTKFELPLLTVYVHPGDHFFDSGSKPEDEIAYPDESVCLGFNGGNVIRGDGNCYYIEKCDHCLNSHLIILAKDRVCIKATYAPSAAGNKSAGEFSLFARRLFTKYLLYSLSHSRETGTTVKIVGTDPKVLESMDDVLAASSSARPVLIFGETGTGKELWANAIHILSSRRNRPMIPVNCAHLRDETMAMSKLFGHKKGAFTGANRNRAGAFRSADHGILFLDEIEALPGHAQEMLLRTLEYGEIHPLGSDNHAQVDVKIIAATNQDIHSLIKNKQLREDFYYRLRTHYIELPPLRDRDPQDILRLATHYLNELNQENDMQKYLGEEVRELFLNYTWPGNVRELTNVLDSSFFSSGYQSKICLDHLVPQIRDSDAIQTRRTGNGHSRVIQLYISLESQKGSFWDLVHAAYLNGKLSRIQVQEIIELGLEKHGTLRKVSQAFHIGDEYWRKFYLFLYRTIYRGDLPERSSVS